MLHQYAKPNRSDLSRPAAKFQVAGSDQTTELEKNSRFGLSDQSISRTGLTTTLNAGSVAAIMVAFSLSSSSRVKGLPPSDLNRDGIDGFLPKPAFLEVDGFTKQPGGKIKRNKSSIRVPQKVLSPSIDVRNRWTVMSARASVMQLAEISDVVANERRCIRVQVRDQKPADHLSVKFGCQRAIAFDDDVGMGHVVVAFVRPAFERNRPGFSRGKIRQARYPDLFQFSNDLPASIVREMKPDLDAEFFNEIRAAIQQLLDHSTGTYEIADAVLCQFVQQPIDVTVESQRSVGTVAIDFAQRARPVRIGGSQRSVFFRRSSARMTGLISTRFSSRGSLSMKYCARLRTSL